MNQSHDGVGRSEFVEFGHNEGFVVGVGFDGLEFFDDQF